jgi:hypothetical protein
VPKARASRERARQAIAATLAAGGAFVLAGIAWALRPLREHWSTAVASGQEGTALMDAAVLAGFAALAATALVGGILLWKNKPLGRALSKLALAAQLVVIATPYFQYKMALFGLLGIGLVGSEISLLLESNTQMSLGFSEDSPTVFVINIPAAIALGVLLNATSHSRKRRRPKRIETSIRSSGVPTAAVAPRTLG